MSRAIICFLSVVAIAAPVSAQEACTHQTYRIEYRTAYQPQQVTAYRMQYETAYTTQKVITHKQVWETQHQVRKYVVRKPVWTTQEREERTVHYEPQVTHTTRYVDQGCWQTQNVYHPGRVTNRLRWMSAANTVDPVTGVIAYQPGGLVWAAQQGPGHYTAHRVWKPNVVAVQTPQTTYVRKVVVRKVPVQVCNYVDEQREERIPVRVCKTVAVEQTVQVPHTVQKCVPVSYTSYVARVVAYRIPTCGCPTACVPTTSATTPKTVVEDQPTKADPKADPKANDGLDISERG